MARSHSCKGFFCGEGAWPHLALHKKPSVIIDIVYYIYMVWIILSSSVKSLHIAYKFIFGSSDVAIFAVHKEWNSDWTKRA